MILRRGSKVLLAAALALLVAITAEADKIDLLTQALLTGGTFRVKVQAALTLGKLKVREPRVIAALIEAMRDDNEAVRVVAAQTLGKLGDASAADALRGAASDKSAMVRTQAQKALDEIAHGGGGAPAVRGPKYLLALSDISPGKADPEAAKLVHDRVLRELGGLPNVTLDPAVAAPKRYIIDGNITNLAATANGAAMRTDCDLRFVVATYPEKSIKMMGSVGSSIDGTNDPKDLASSRTDCLKDTAKQLVEKVQTFLESQH